MAGGVVMNGGFAKSLDGRRLIVQDLDLGMFIQCYMRVMAFSPKHCSERWEPFGRVATADMALRFLFGEDIELLT